MGPQGLQGPQGPQGDPAPATGIAVDEEGTTNGGRLRLTADVAGPGNDAAGSPGDFVPGHHVLIVENQRGTSTPGDDGSYNTGGVAVVLNSRHPDLVTDPLNRINSSDNYMTFFERGADGSEKVVGRIEGVSPLDVANVFQGLASLALDANPADLFTFDVELNPVENWLTVDWPTLTGGSTGTLQHPGYVPPSLAGGSFTHTNQFPSFSPGVLPSASLDPGSLPSIHWPGLDFANWSFNPGSLPALSFSPGALPGIDWGSLDDPALGFSLTFPTLGLGSLATPGLGFQYTPPTFPTLTTGAITQVQSPFRTFNLGFDVDRGLDLGVTLFEEFGGAASFYWEAKSDPVAFSMKYAMTAFTAGVTYESGSGDYAEWLERLDPNETLSVADVVGVHGDKITRATEGANQVMVISFKPIVLGNMPDESRKELYEKVAFLGQTLVKIRGVFRKGDLIVPSGFEDGTAIALPVQRVPVDQLERVVGVAWADGGDRSGGVSLAHIAVGLSSAQMAKVMRAEWQRSADRVTELERQNQALTAELASVRSQVAGLEALKSELLALAAELQAGRRR